MGKGKAKAKRQAKTPPLTEYERRRQERIKENQARLETLGLPALTYSLLEGARTPQHNDTGDETTTTKRRRNGGNDHGGVDDEYRPSDEAPSSPSESEDGRRDRGKGSRRKGKNKVTPVAGKSRKKLFDECSKGESNIDDENTAFAQAIALSLGENVNSDGVQSTCSQKSHMSTPRKDNDGKGSFLESIGRGKKKKLNPRRVQMTEDEAIAHFFSFDEAGKGSITLKDLERMALCHDFFWSDKELANMIYLFDTDGDGKDFEACKVQQKLEEVKKEATEDLSKLWDSLYEQIQAYQEHHEEAVTYFPSNFIQSVLLQDRWSGKRKKWRQNSIVSKLRMSPLKLLL